MNKKTLNIIGACMLSFGSQVIGLMTSMMTNSLYAGMFVMVWGLLSGIRMMSK